MHLSRVLSTCALLGSLCGTVFGQPSFQRLGEIDADTQSSFATGVSADGKVVVGYVYYGPRDDTQAFRWTADGGMVGLGFLSNVASPDSLARGVSADGSVIVGESVNAAGQDEAFIWTAAGGITGLGRPPGASVHSSAFAVSADGAVVVGLGYWPATNRTNSVAFRWTSTSGMAALGGGEGVPDSRATGVSADGNVIAGQTRSEGGSITPFRWTASTGMTRPPGLPHPTLSNASAISADGSTIVGTSGLEAFRWTEASGTTTLENLTRFRESHPLAVSGDGSVVVGTSGEDGIEAFLWTQVTGAVDLKEYLIAAGVNGLDGWTLTRATGISADGQTIVGYGTNGALGLAEHAWIAVVPEPATAYAAAAAVCLTLRPRRAIR